jgi:hypothetical protein
MGNWASFSQGANSFLTTLTTSLFSSMFIDAVELSAARFALHCSISIIARLQT